MIVLGMDTATSATSVALSLADGTVLSERDDPAPGGHPGHATRLLPMAAGLLGTVGLRWDALDLLAVGLGPGTFTGLRVGVATAKGLAFGGDCVVIPVPTLAAIHAGKHVALANKESLVVAGELVTRAARAKGVALLPVDSEHNAIFQALQGHDRTEVRRLVLTASGGPFLARPAVELANVTVAEALNHPTWKMGPKITIDSATLMNKGLEVIEARWLFDVDADHIDVVIHPQSIVHSMVEYIDGSVLAQMAVPDMTIPIAYALAYPARLPLDYLRPLDLPAAGTLTFVAPDRQRFPCLDLAYRALRAGGTMPAVLNAANEIAVERFLAEDLAYREIPALVAAVMNTHEPAPASDLDVLLAADRWARDAARQWGALVAGRAAAQR
jgi:1-deoxy-D-xylulose-5-phosphate reductoisomerase